MSLALLGFFLGSRYIVEAIMRIVDTKFANLDMSDRAAQQIVFKFLLETLHGYPIDSGCGILHTYAKSDETYHAEWSGDVAWNFTDADFVLYCSDRPDFKGVPVYSLRGGWL